MPPVTVYSKPHCMPCNLTKKRLNDAGIPYTEVDITESAEAMEFVRNLGALAAPVVVVGEGESQDHWSGFNPDRLAGLVKLSQAALV